MTGLGGAGGSQRTAGAHDRSGGRHVPGPGRSAASSRRSYAQTLSRLAADIGADRALAMLDTAQDATDREGLTSKAAYERLGVPADARDYAASAALLHHLGIREIALMSNSPHKRRCLEAAGIRVPTTLPVKSPDGSLENCYAWKRNDFGHHV